MNTRRKCSTLACNVLKKSKHVVKNTLIIPIYPHPNFVPLKKKNLSYTPVSMKNVAYAISFLDIITYLLWIDIGALNLSLLVLKKLLKMLIVMIKICYTPFKIIGLKTSTILYFPKSLWSISFTLGSRTCTINVILKSKSQYHLQIISAVSEQMITNIIWIKSLHVPVYFSRSRCPDLSKPSYGTNFRKSKQWTRYIRVSKCWKQLRGASLKQIWMRPMWAKLSTSSHSSSTPTLRMRNPSQLSVRIL